VFGGWLLNNDTAQVLYADIWSITSLMFSAERAGVDNICTAVASAFISNTRTQRLQMTAYQAGKN
jgi:hypothetical protein